jgi:hypothetical protein
MPFFIILLFVLVIILFLKLSEGNSRIRELDMRLNQRIDQLQKKLAEALREIADLRKSGAVEESSATIKNSHPIPAVEAPSIEKPKEPASEIPAKKPDTPEPIQIPSPIAIVQTPIAPIKKQETPPQKPPVHSKPGFDWENLVGVKLFSWIAGVALLFAAIFFLRYSIHQGWLMPPVRMAIGILTAIILIVVCELKAARKYPITANAMDGAAIAILFSTFFAAHSLWNLISLAPAFLLMVVVAILAVLLSIKRNSLFIALLGLLGGFAIPALLSTGENRPISLFSYLLLLNAGLTWIGAKKKWPLLTALSLIFTAFYQWGWVVKFLTTDQFSTALGIFLAFPIFAFIAAALGKKEQPEKGWMSLYGQTRNLTAFLPILFAFYAAAVPGYGNRYAFLFSFLFLINAGLLAIAIFQREETLHLFSGFSTIIVWTLWLKNSYESSAWPGLLVFIALFFAFYLIAPLLAKYFNRRFVGQGEMASFASPILLFVFPALTAMEPACANPGLIFAVLFLLLLGALIYGIYTEKGSIYLIAGFFALIAEAIWSSLYLQPNRLLAGWTVYLAFALLYAGAPIVARKFKKILKPATAVPLLPLMALALLLFFAASPTDSISIAGLALLLLVLNISLFIESKSNQNSFPALVGVVLSWIVLGVLWANLPLATMLKPALAIMTGFVLFFFAGYLWLQRKMSDPSDDLLTIGIFLGSVGHLFLFVVASQNSLSIPPWSFFSVLLILDLAMGLAAILALNKLGSALFRTAMALSGFLLIAWTASAASAPWPAIAIFAAMALSILSIAWIYFAKRFHVDDKRFIAPALTIILSQAVAIVASFQAGAPDPGFLVFAHLFFIAALIALAWIYEMHLLAALALLPATIAIFGWQIQHLSMWREQFIFSIPIYLAFLAYPLLLGRRQKQSIEPCLTAVFASAAFFFEARQSFLSAGWNDVIGILPVAQALAMGFLILRLLRIEPAGKRSGNRLALIAGAALAFITIAIPMQLDREWITIGWALEAVAVAWLYKKISHKGLLYLSSALFAAVFVRLAFNPAVLHYQPRSGIQIWNWYLYAYLIPAISMISGGRLLSRLRTGFFQPDCAHQDFCRRGESCLYFCW